MAYEMSSGYADASTSPGSAAIARDPFLDASVMSSWRAQDDEADVGRRRRMNDDDDGLLGASAGENDVLGAWASLRHSRMNTSSSSGSESSPSRPGMPSSRTTNEIERDLALAMSDESLPAPQPVQQMAAVSSESISRKAATSKPRGAAKPIKEGSLWHQWKTSTGIFGPLVPPEPPMTREDRERRERERTEAIKNGKSRSSKRPSFLKRASSGLELFSK